MKYFVTRAMLAALAGFALAGGAAAQNMLPVLTPQQAQQLQQFQQQQSLIGQPPGAPTVARAGQTTEAEAGVSAAPALGEAPRNTGGPTAVFGAGIFTREATAASDAPNPNYIIQPGDRVSVRVWGAVDAEGIMPVDSAGNIFLPNIGPVRLVGTRAGDVQRVVEGEVRRIYTQQVQVYAVLLSTQRIGVFVTGFVRTPGRFGGSAADSVIDFLQRAGGVDPTRGSFRDISIMRGGRAIATVDLYRFLLEGRLPPVRLQEGDTLLVGRQRALVGADGAVRNNFLFEVPGRTMSGRELVDYARPLPSATNAIITGNRDGRPFSRYATLAELSSIPLSDQDVVTFITDRPAQTVRVMVEGSRIGPSVLVADRDVTLCQALDYIAVDPGLADTNSIYLLRPRVAQQQRRAMEEAIERLERQLFTAVSATTGVANIRSQEANLVASYLQRARRTQPEGRVVVFDSNGRCSSVRLENEDVIVIPERSSTVLVSGEVTAPRAVVWNRDMSINDYVQQAGGYTQRGSSRNVMIRRASGELVLDPREGPRPGDELIAMPRLDPKLFQIATDFSQLIFQAAFAARTVQNW